MEGRSTRVVFGDYICVYTMKQYMEDGNTVPIYHDGILANVHLTNKFMDEEFEEITESEKDIVKEKLKTKWARLDTIVCTEPRLKQIQKI